MTVDRVRATRPGWVRTVTWIAVLAPVPYSLLRLVWAVGLPIGITEDFLDALGSPGWGSLGLVLLAALSEGTALFTRRFVLEGAERVPRWVPAWRRHPLSPRAVVRLLLLPILVLTAANLESVHELVMDGEFRSPADFPGQPAWSVWAHPFIFWIWGAALTVATTAYWRDHRPTTTPGGTI